MTLRGYLEDFLYFGLKQVRSALFAGLFFALLLSSRYLSTITEMYRYDLLFIGAIIIQVILIHYVT